MYKYRTILNSINFVKFMSYTLLVIFSSLKHIIYWIITLSIYLCRVLKFTCTDYLQIKLILY